MSASNLPAGADHSEHPAPCGCLWSMGQWFPCDAHRTPHSQHTTPCPGCEVCQSALEEARETLSEGLDEEPDAETIYGTPDCADGL